MGGVIYRFGDCELDEERGELRRDGYPVALQPKPFALLAYLVAHRDRIVDKDELLDVIWGGAAVTESSLSKAVSLARKAIGDRGRPGWIRSHHRRGYRFAGEVAALGAARAPRTGVRSGSTDPFVGRAPALRALRAAWRSAAGGRGRMALVVGEAGIGKTRLGEALADEVGAQGGRVLRARCEDAEGAPAYWPWAQVVRALVAPGAPGERAVGPGVEAAQLAQVLPELHTPGVDPVEARSEADRFRLFHAVASLLLRAGRRQPTLVLLDGLQWADASSLELLRYLAGEIPEGSLLVVCMLRDPTPGRSEPFRRLLADLARYEHCTRIDLGGLAQEEVAGYLAVAAGGPVPDAIAREVRSVTDGNPFFVREIVRIASERGGAGLLRFGHTWTEWRRKLPVGVQGVVGQRIEALPPEVRRILRVASTIGREFGVPLVATAADVPRVEVLDALDAAIAARIVEESGGSAGAFRFAHALLRDALYDGLAPGERARLHRRVGEALEKRAGPVRDAHLPQLAHHFHAALPAGQEDKALEYAVAAARRAARVTAWEEAALHYGQALDALEQKLPDEPGRVLEVLLELGEAHLRAGDAGATRDAFERAAGLARELGNGEAFVRAALGYGGSALWGAPPDETQRGLLEEALARVGEEPSRERASLLSRLAVIRAFRGDPAEQRPRVLEAHAIARSLHDARAIAETLHARHFLAQGPLCLEEREALAREILASADELGMPDVAFAIPESLAADRLMRGDRAGFDEALAVSQELAARAPHPPFLWISMLTRASVALLEGRFEQAEPLMLEASSLGQRARNPQAVPLYLAHTLALRRAQGRGAELLPVLESLGDRLHWIGAYPRTTLAALYAELGRADEARAAFEGVARADFADLPVRDDWLVALAELSRVCAFVGDRERAERLTELLEPYADLHAVYPGPLLYAGPVRGVLGLLARARGRHTEATRQLEEALEAAAAVGARPVGVEVRLDLARCLREGGMQSGARRAMALLREAADEARALGMAAAARRATDLLEGAP